MYVEHIIPILHYTVVYVLGEWFKNVFFLAHLAGIGGMNDVTPSPSSSVSEGLDLFPDSPLHRYLSTFFFGFVWINLFSIFLQQARVAIRYK